MDSLQRALSLPVLPGNSVIVASLSVCSWTHCIQSQGQQPIFHLIPPCSKPVFTTACPLLSSPCPELPRLKLTDCCSLHNPRRYKGVKNAIFLHFHAHYMSREAISPLHTHTDLQQKADYFFGSPGGAPAMRILPASTTNSNKNYVTVAPRKENVTFPMV